MNITIFPSQLKGTVKIPSSKSLVHRHLIASFLAGEKREIPVRGLSQDILHTMKGLYALGGDFSIKDEKIFFAADEPLLKREKFFAENPHPPCVF